MKIGTCYIVSSDETKETQHSIQDTYLCDYYMKVNTGISIMGNAYVLPQLCRYVGAQLVCEW